MMSAWDSYAAHETASDRTIHVDGTGLSTTDFDLTQRQCDDLFLRRVTAASR